MSEAEIKEKVLQSMIESGATPQAIAKVMVQQEILNAIGKSPDDMAKGQLISECLFDQCLLNFPKNQRKIWQISALESKKWSNHKIKAHYNDFDTNYVQIIINVIRRCLYFVDLTTF